MANILLIDDDELQLAMQRAILTAEGHTVFTTADGPHGIEIFKSRPIDLVLLDVGIPSMSGFEVLKELKNINPEIKVIIITAYPSIESAKLSMKYNADDYIQKPFEVEYYLERIKNALQNV
ncbi:MAG: Response regulator of zinc sigma-54-dependent two-component system [Ignavibacteriae bacterium]|nr:MAG: Response regulator of zinc sigma-54-dependent two-component system [Ignavibacteriota bacterium]